MALERCSGSITIDVLTTVWWAIGSRPKKAAAHYCQRRDMDPWFTFGKPAFVSTLDLLAVANRRWEPVQHFQRPIRSPRYFSADFQVRLALLASGYIIISTLYLSLSLRQTSQIVLVSGCNGNCFIYASFTGHSLFTHASNDYSQLPAV